jgi:glycosyltransferase involved in cell wall biosynthesis
MTEPPAPAGEPQRPTDDTDLLRRLREAEASIELLQSTARAQESLADRLTASMAAAASAQQELAAARQQRGARSSVQRVARRLGRPGPRPAPEPSLAASEWTSRNGILADTRYGHWVEMYDTLDDAGRLALLAQLEEVDDKPLVSIILPVYDPSEEFLREAIESVRRQMYENWELCISDDCSTQAHVAKVLEEYAAADARIRVISRDVNGHISASSNSAISLAGGDWICLMDHDDLLADHALAVAVLALSRTADPAILYSDEDHIDDENQRLAPYFKPDFDPLLILGQNYFSHLCMIRADLVTRVGGFRVGYEGSQDWDLVLRVLEIIRPDQVVHVPHVLYHWRVHPGSTASSVSAKPYVVEASRRVVQEHLDRIGIEAEVQTAWGGSFNRIRWALPPDPPAVSVIILPRTGTRLGRCIESILSLTAYPNLEVVVVDDGGFRPPTRQFLRDRADSLTMVEVRDDLSDAAERNLAARAARGEILCFVDDNVEVMSTNWLEEVVGTLSHPGVGCVGIKLLYPDFTIAHAGLVLGIGGTVGYPHRLLFDRLSNGYFGRLTLAQCPSAVSMAVMALRRQAFDEVGGFSEEHLTGLFGDVDLCLRLAEAGWRTGWTPRAEMLHYERPEDTRGAEGKNGVRFDRDVRYLQRRWRRFVEDDPAYNPNLSLAHETFPLAWPPRSAVWAPRPRAEDPGIR